MEVRKARSNGGGFKLFHHDVHRKRNGVEVILEEEDGGEESIRQGDEFKAGNKRVYVEGCQHIHSLQVGCQIDDKEDVLDKVWMKWYRVFLEMRDWINSSNFPWTCR